MKRLMMIAVMSLSMMTMSNAQEPVDTTGFTNWLNATRASYGLSPVGYDPNLSVWAQHNNLAQLRNGMGHYVMGTARRQNSAMGTYDVNYVNSMWMSSAPHRAALLDPTITWIGIAAVSGYWTFNAR